MLGMSSGQTLFILFFAVVGLVILGLSIITSIENVRIAKHKASAPARADKEPDRQPAAE
jgi:hypothetical protein